MITVDRLQPEDETGYDRLVEEASEGMLYHTIKWRNLLAAFAEAEPAYLVARDDGRVVGLLPAFIKRNPQYGDVLNSLPFYGHQAWVTRRHSVWPCLKLFRLWLVNRVASRLLS
jgi:hypothetical protein